MSDQAESQAPKAHIAWSLPLFSVSGIPIRVHFTFLLFLAWIGFGLGDMSGVLWVGFVIAIFGCVLLHELGHALVAKNYGIKTRNITLYPIGGVALLDGRPKPQDEIVIAIAGPLVNLVIAGLLTPFVLTFYGKIDLATNLETRGGFLSAVIVANLTLGVFNLIPAFPMDGGRVLRAVLNLSRSERSATQIAAGVGQALAIALGFAGAISGNVILFIIAAFVFLGAGQELSATVTRSFLEGHTVSDAMQTQFRRISNGASMEQAAQMLIEGSQHDFPVVIGEEVIGLLTRNAIAKGLAEDGATGFVAGHMNRDFKRVSPEAPLESAVEMFADGDSSPILVLAGDELVGMLATDNLSEFIMLEHARAQTHRVGV